jgi:hypothetical protein
MKYRFLTLSLSVLTLVGSMMTGRAQDAGAPHLAKRGEATQLIVDGKPYLMLGAEIHNSSSSSLEYMEPEWPRLAAMGVNTVLTQARRTEKVTLYRFE